MNQKLSRFVCSFATKIFFTLYLALYFSQTGKTQETYDSLVVPGKIFSTCYTVQATWYCYRSRFSSEQVELEGRLYRYLERSYTETGDDWEGRHGYFREEGKKTYQYDSAEEAEILQFDFSLEHGDTFTIYPDGHEFNVKVIDSDTVMFTDGVPRKRLTVACQPLGLSGAEWIEGIGSIGGLNITQFMCFVDRGEGLTLCYEENGNTVQLWENRDYCWMETISVEESATALSFQITPNPTNQSITITNPLQKDCYILYNLLGQSLLEDCDGEMDLSQFPNGTYLVRSKKTMQVEKVVKF